MKEGKIILFDTFTKKRKIFQFPPLNECLKKYFPFMNPNKIKSRNLYKSFQSEYVETSQNNIIGEIIERIELIDDRKFKRSFQIRFDDTYHNNKDIHLNIDVVTSYNSSNKKAVHKELLGKFHSIDIGCIAHAIYITIVWPGKMWHQPIVILPSEIDKNYHEAERIYLKRLKEGDLSKKEKIKFKQIFDDYVKYIKSKK